MTVSQHFICCSLKLLSAVTMQNSAAQVLYYIEHLDICIASHLQSEIVATF